MQRLLTGIAIGVVMTATVLLAVTVVAQDAGPLALGRPLLVDVRQSVPVLADVVVPLDNDTTVNATVPLTLEVALQIAVSGVISESVQVARSQPVVAVSAPPVALPSQTMLQQAQPLIYAGLQWTVRSAANVGAVYDDPQDQRAALMTENAFLVVQLAVENLGAASKEVDYDDDEFSILLRDSTGRRFAWREHPTTCAEHDLNPGLIKSCPLLFEVPRNAQGFSVIFTSENGYEQSVPLGF